MSGERSGIGPDFCLDSGWDSVQDSGACGGIPVGFLSGIGPARLELDSQQLLQIHPNKHRILPARLQPNRLKCVSILDSERSRPLQQKLPAPPGISKNHEWGVFVDRSTKKSPAIKFTDDTLIFNKNGGQAPAARSGGQTPLLESVSRRPDNPTLETVRSSGDGPNRVRLVFGLWLVCHVLFCHVWFVQSWSPSPECFI